MRSLQRPMSTFNKDRMLKEPRSSLCLKSFQIEDRNESCEFFFNSEPPTLDDEFAGLLQFGGRWVLIEYGPHEFLLFLSCLFNALR